MHAQVVKPIRVNSIGKVFLGQVVMIKFDFMEFEGKQLYCVVIRELSSLIN
jgi:hypothetical protein